MKGLAKRLKQSFCGRGHRPRGDDRRSTENETAGEYETANHKRTSQAEKYSVIRRP